MTQENWPKHNAHYDELPASLQQQYDDFVRYLLGHQQIELITIENRIAGHVLRYMRWLNERKGITSLEGCGAKLASDFLSELPQMKTASVNKFIQSIRGLMKWMCVQEFIPANEIYKFDLVKPGSRHTKSKKVPRALTPQQVAVVFRNIMLKWPYDPWPVDKLRRHGFKKLGRPGRTRLRRAMMNVQLEFLVMAVLELGLRRAELHRLTVHDIDPVNDTILVLGKGNKERIVPYPEALKPFARKWLAHRKLIVGNKGKAHDQVWVRCSNPWGETMTGEGFRVWIKKVYDGDIDEAWHILRKTFATQRWRSGMDVTIISRLLGHEDIKTTEFYLGIDDDDMLRESKEYEGYVSDAFAKMHDKGVAAAEALLNYDNEDDDAGSEEE